jgi:hypothetical protein
MGSLRGYKSPTIAVPRLVVVVGTPHGKRQYIEYCLFPIWWELLTDKQNMLEYQRR